MNFRKKLIIIYFVFVLLFVVVLIIGNLYTIPRFLFIIFVVIYAPLILFSCFIWYIFIAMIGTPKGKIANFPVKDYSSEIFCEQITRSIYRIHLKNNEYTKYKSQHYFEVDMSGWLFKKTYIRDIVLMNYHLHYFNKCGLLHKKIFSKKYFVNENMCIVFNLLNGKKVTIPMIKNGIEKRSFIVGLKYFFPIRYIYRRSRANINKKYYYFDLFEFYF